MSQMCTCMHVRQLMCRENFNLILNAYAFVRPCYIGLVVMLSFRQVVSSFINQIPCKIEVKPCKVVNIGDR